jgi:hypothetical protein
MKESTTTFAFIMLMASRRPLRWPVHDALLKAGFDEIKIDL